MPAEIPPSIENPDPSGPAPSPRRRVPVSLVAVVGLGIGVAIGIIAAAFTSDSGRSEEPEGVVVLEEAREVAAAEQEAAAAAFVEAWARSRQATYTAHLVFSREGAGGASIRSDSTYTQAPPRRALRNATEVHITNGADSVTCSTIGEVTTCVPAPATDYAAEVDHELALWRALVTGATPTYRVREPMPGCFQLDRVAAALDAPYGDIARFCFDDATGALVRRQVVRPTATDVEEALTLDTEIPPDAFDPPAPVAR